MGSEMCISVRAHLVAAVVAAVARHAPHLKVAVIAAYRAQTKVLRDAVATAARGSLDVEVATVDAFQGREKDLVLVSCVRAPPTAAKRGHVQTIGFLKDKHRLNVLLSRARLARWIFGHGDTLRQNDDWKNVLRAADKRKAYHTLSLIHI